MSAKRIKASPCVWYVPGKEYSTGYFLRADAESYEQMVEQVAAAIQRVGSLTSWNQCTVKEAYREDARAAFRAIGITQPKRSQKGGRK